MLIAPMAALDMVLVEPMINALAIIESMVIQRGLIPIALAVLALSMSSCSMIEIQIFLIVSYLFFVNHAGMLLGLELLKMLTMPILLLSALIRVFVIVTLELANVSLTMTVLLVKEPFAPICAVIPVFVSLKINWLLKLVVYTLILGMLTNTLDVFAIWAAVDLIAL